MVSDLQQGYLLLTMNLFTYTITICLNNKYHDLTRVWRKRISFNLIRAKKISPYRPYTPHSKMIKQWILQLLCPKQLKRQTLLCSRNKYNPCSVKLNIKNHNLNRSKAEAYETKHFFQGQNFCPICSQTVSSRAL